MNKTRAPVTIALLLASGAAWWIGCLRDAARPQNSGTESRAQDGLVQDELPSSWSLDEIAKATPPYGLGSEGVTILAWQRWGNERLRGESCLVMRVLEKDDGYGRWCLAHLYRHPDAKDPRWQLSMMHVSGSKEYGPGMWIHHSKRLKEQPTNKTLYAALSDGVEGVNWRFEPDDDTTLIGAGVCEENWQKMTGEKPTRFFRR